VRVDVRVKTEWFGDVIAKEIRLEIIRANGLGSDVLADRMRVEVPVRRGNLQRSIGSENDPETLTGAAYAGGPGARHAVLVERGTVHSVANPFMRRSAEATKQQIYGIYVRELSI
jgi:HK97 gp10 family phage protein